MSISLVYNANTTEKIRENTISRKIIFCLILTHDTSHFFFFNLDSRLERTFVSYHVQFRKNIARNFYELLLFFGFCMVCDDGRKNNHRFGSTRGWFCKLGIFFFKMFFFYYFNLFSKNSFSGGKCFLDIFFIIKKNQKIH